MLILDTSNSVGTNVLKFGFKHEHPIPKQLVLKSSNRSLDKHIKIKTSEVNCERFAFLMLYNVNLENKRYRNLASFYKQKNPTWI